ncbi:MAG: neuraminidase-like domain-containing protein, partial [Vicinamibacterales bacterium]
LLDDFSNLVTAENVIFPFASADPGDGAGETILDPGETLYFCTPPNDRLLKYWDTIDDRLFKIRHCMDIEGVIRPLALVEPPIDPALLVRATAAGLDVQSVLAELAAPPPHHRFSYLIQKANELCGEVRSFGAALSSALEKQDGETLAALRATHEVALLDATRAVRERQVAEAAEQRLALERTREVTERRLEFYRDIAPRIEQEVTYSTKLGEAELEQDSRRSKEETGSFVALIPDITVVMGPSPPSSSIGGSHLASLFRALAGRHAAEAERHLHAATMASVAGGWARRQEEWNLQRDLAALELKQIDRQIAAAGIREEMARREVENHQLQIEQSVAARDFLRDKFTNEELYGWMISETSALYYQAYKLAYSLARRAQRAFELERGPAAGEAGLIQFGYWDSLRKGLLAGERLALDLRRLEMAYLETDRREYEIVRHVSLVLHDPMALVALKETGVCEVELPEELWDGDYPGHYFRRIKTVGITIPCVVGPYTGINCTLTLLSNRVRTSPGADDPYPEQAPGDPRFVYDFAAMQSIATSQAQNDVGLFELNFRDERYLPFEGAGAISRWRFELQRETNAFDLETISDVVLRVAFTARDGGALLRAAALAARDVLWDTPPSDPSAPVPPLRRLFSARHEFPDAWQRFLHPQPDGAQTLELPLAPERFPYSLRGRDIHVTRVDVYLKPKEGADPALPALTLLLPSQPAPVPMTVAPDGLIPLAHASLADLDEGPGTWTLNAPGPPALTPANTRDLILVLTCYASKP